MSLLFPRRSTEATVNQLIATGAAGGFGIDPIDGDSGFRPVGSQHTREIPVWTLDKARAYSVAAYRTNPMARAVLDTYTSFCVGDSGLTLQCTNPLVRAEAEGFWNDPRNAVVRQELALRHHMLQGESIYEMLLGRLTTAIRFSPIDATRVIDVVPRNGNPLWPGTLIVRLAGAEDKQLSVIDVDDITGLRSGEATFWADWKALMTDRRGYPFLGPILDDLDSYDAVLSNLIDRTALARYLVWDVTVDGDQTQVDDFIKRRGGTHVPLSGTVEVHNKSVVWEQKTAQVGTQEDTATAKAVLTNIAGGAGLAKTWLAEPEDANRATSLTMAEPVRRRVGGVQNLWVGHVTDLVRFAVDRAVAAGRLPTEVESVDVSGNQRMVPTAQTVTVTGPEVAAADAQIVAEILVNLGKGLTEMVAAKILTPEAARVATKKAWEQFVGIPYNPELDKTSSSSDPDALADVIDQAQPAQVNFRLS